MRYGIKTAPQHCTWQEMLDIWTLADQGDVFESAWNFDHFYPLVGDVTGPCMEGWVTLAALAQATERIRIGCMVNGIHYRHPAVVANMAATLDIVSNGRLDLGLGAGWHEDESAAYGIPLGSLTERFDRFDEGVEAIDGLLTAATTDFDGKYFQLKDARCEPKPMQRPRPPMVIGGGGERRTLRTVARWAQHWNLPFADPARFTHKREVLLGHCEAVGRDPRKITTSVQIAFEAEQDPAEAVDQAAALFDAGVDVVIFTLRTPYRVSTVEALSAALS
jgi:F420-dependent oxidoreductase-like protein